MQGQYLKTVLVLPWRKYPLGATAWLSSVSSSQGATVSHIDRGLSLKRVRGYHGVTGRGELGFVLKN